MYQRIDGGNGHIQAGGDVVVNPTPRYPENNPNIVKCPQCWSAAATDRAVSADREAPGVAIARCIYRAREVEEEGGERLTVHMTSNQETVYG